MFLSVETTGRVSIVKRTTNSSPSVESGACLRLPVCVCFFACLYFFTRCPRDLLLTSFHFFLAALKRPKLGADGHNRVLRALHHNQHHFKHFIRPQLLALYSFGLEPSEAVLTCRRSIRKVSVLTLCTSSVGRHTF